MIKFENSIDFSNILKRTQEYFDEGEYISLIKYVGRFCAECPNYIKAELLQKVACVYEKWGSDDKAIATLKLAAMFDEKSLETYYLLAKILLKNQRHLGFQQAFFKVGALDVNHEYIGDFLNELRGAEEQSEFNIVTEQSKRKDRFLHCLDVVMSSNAKVGFKELEDFLKIYPYDKEAGELYIAQCYSLKYVARAENFVSEWIKIYPNDPIVLSNYILVKGANENYDPTADIDRLSRIKINDMNTFKEVIRAFDISKKYAQAICVIDAFVAENNLQNNYDLLVMKAIALFNNGDVEQALSLARHIEILYGQIGLGELYSFVFEQKKMNGWMMFVDQLPLGENEQIFDIFNELLQEKDRKKLFENAKLYIKYSLINGELFDANMFAYLCKKFCSEKFAREIMMFLNLHGNTFQMVKAQMIKGLIDCGVRKFCFFTAGGVERVEYQPIAELQYFPKCYGDAYKLAFAYCGLNSIADANDLLINSTMQLIEVMQKEKRKFNNVTALAGAILCNSYMIAGADIVMAVSSLLDIKQKTLENCIKTIRQYGAFFDLDQDEAAMEYIQKIVARFGDIDSLND